ncbi:MULTISPECIES: hypothetical protein [Chryseobacterium]|nr:hypothetical protein HMPREF0204_14803 [Chryseobacterium gleum ATCC 35910]
MFQSRQQIKYFFIMKKILFPVILVALGTGSAFATMVAKKSTRALEPAYRIVSLGGGQFQCEDADQECSNIVSGDVCEWALDTSVELHRIGSGTMCGTPLYKIP